MRPRPSKPNEVIRVLRQLGFYQETSGATSHLGYCHDDGRKVVVAMHPGDIPTGTLRGMIKSAGITVQKFNEMV
jgi:predicted RNA binding protein YcfA (HicA-like mRNA interferase family)